MSRTRCCPYCPREGWRFCLRTRGWGKTGNDSKFSGLSSDELRSLSDKISPQDYDKFAKDVFYTDEEARKSIVNLISGKSWDFLGPTKAASVASMDLSERISAEVLKASGNSFHNVKLLSSAPNHNHEDIVETIERYSVTIERAI